MPRGASASVGAALAEAKAAHEAGDLRTADRLYRRILKKAPDNALALNLYGILASQRGDAKNAVKRLRRAVANDGDTLDYRINLGIVLESTGDFVAAYDCYAAALERAPRNGDILSRLAEAAKECNRYEDLASALSVLCAANPDYPDAHFLLGLTMNMLHRFEAAVEALHRATSLAPDLIQAHSNLASALMDLGRPGEALAACEETLQRNPGDSFALATKAIALAEAGERAQLNRLIDFDSLLEVRTLDAPAGYAGIEAFNAALEEAVLAHPSLRLDPNHRSCHFADQTDDIFLEPAEPFATLERAIRAQAEDYRLKLDSSATQAFLANPAPKTELVGWATVMRAQGHQSAHIHPTSWLSGVYYPRVPDLVKRSNNAHKGWIELGRPPEHYPITREPEVTFIEPLEGKLILFPSYLYHRTVPYDDDALRISIAFDFDPTLVV